MEEENPEIYIEKEMERQKSQDCPEEEMHGIEQEEAEDIVDDISQSTLGEANLDELEEAEEEQYSEDKTSSSSEEKNAIEEVVDIRDSIVEDRESTIIEQSDRVASREKGFKANGKPLLWKEEIEEYSIDNAENILSLNENAILEVFQNKVLESSIFRIPTADAFYREELRKKKIGYQWKTEEELKAIKTRLLSNFVPHAQKSIRKRKIEEYRIFNSIRQLHVNMKQKGYNTATSSMFSVLAKEYLIQKKDILHWMKNLSNLLMKMEMDIEDDVKYVQKCIDFMGAHDTL
ncbi:hypothetical protein NEFER03_0030 [Nematocida sp. LUAm3]|nr:hypothetical protein NEFER03_0030 [Nematocida sp. LUAm3]KAI5176246.1 hypothetical protein NEFER02_2043 [Nematocida sp. LUAm2]KAI5176704.1 hypothetical protein NEFER01_0029 [Nematocida sp. LUAm1]